MIYVGSSLLCPVFAQDQMMEMFDGCNTLDATSSLGGDQQVLETAQGIILYELGSETMVYSHNPDQLIDPAGMNKILTAMLALEHGDPESMVTVSNTALSAVASDALTIGLVNGEQIKLKDLLYCLMVSSANDAAAVIAEHIAGGQTAFVEMMNAKALQLGCTNTVFANPTGLSHEDQHATARDLAKITVAAIEIEGFMDYFSAVSYIVPATNKSQERKLTTTNYMMSTATVGTFFDQRVIGGKTGAFSSTDRSLICIAETEEARYLSVVMGAQGTRNSSGVSYANFHETAQLLKYGFENYALRRLLTQEQVLGQFEVIDGENDVAVAPVGAVYTMMPKDMPFSELTYRCIRSDQGITAPLKAGEVVGSVQVWYGSLCVSQSELVAMHDVARSGEHIISLTTGSASASGGAIKTIAVVVLMIILLILAVVGVVVLLRRFRRGRGPQKRNKGRR